MCKKNDHTEEIALDSEIFQRLNQSLESGIEASSTELFAKLAEVLVERRLISKSGKIAANREACLEYLEKVLPHMTFRDFAVLQAEPQLFVDKYVFRPTERRTSLAIYLQEQEILDDSFELKSDLGWRGNSSEIFEEFWEQMEMSPFEQCDRYVVANYWGSMEWIKGAFRPLSRKKNISISFCFLFQDSYNSIWIFVCRKFRYLKE